MTATKTRWIGFARCSRNVSRETSGPRLTDDARVRTFAASGKGKNMSAENQGRDADIRVDYRAQFTLDGPEGRQIEVTA